MENIAESYLEQLVQRGMLHIIRAYYHNQANHPIRSIMLHPSLHLIIKSSAGKYKFEGKELLPYVIDSVDAFDKYICRKDNNKDEDEKKNDEDEDEDEDDFHSRQKFAIRKNLEKFHGLALHMPYQFNQISAFGKGPNLQRFHHPSLHSLFFFCYVAPVASPPFTFLRVLAVFSSHLRFPEEYTPCWLDELINLRYLGFIVCLVEGGSLGKTLDRLVKLEILDLSESFVSGLSEFIKNNEKVKVVGPVKEELPEIWSPIPDMFQ